MSGSAKAYEGKLSRARRYTGTELDSFNRLVKECFSQGISKSRYLNDGVKIFLKERTASEKPQRKRCTDNIGYSKQGR